MNFGKKRVFSDGIKLMAESIVSYTLCAKAERMTEAHIQETICGYLQMMEHSIRGTISLENMTRLHPLEIKEFMKTYGRKP